MTRARELQSAPRLAERMGTVELVPSARRLRTNHEPALAPLIGREDVLARVAEAFASGVRLLTVVGPPGIGKTRLASACLDRMGEAFARRGGAWFCDLSQAKTEQDLRFAVFSLLGEKAPDLQLTQQEVGARLRELLQAAGSTLLVLDNFEQLTFAAEVVHEWCRAAPKLTVLVTSRERLNVDGETVLELPPLSCPDESAAAVEGFDAVTLFVARVREAGGSLGDDPAAVAEIVRRLEGIPLAIELAAARTRVLSATDLARRLAGGHDVLAKLKHREGGRHATLTSAIAWSWDLLSLEEQVALARCSVFSGSFALDIAEAVLGGGETSLDLLTALRDKSLLHPAEHGRLALYVSIREFAARKLTELGPETVHETRRRHAYAFAAAARTFGEARNLQNKGPKGALYAGFRRDKENLLEALAFVRAQPLTAAHARMQADLAGALAHLLVLPGETSVAELSAALSSLEVYPDAVSAASLLFARQGVLNSLGQYDACRADLERVRAMTDLPAGLHLLALVDLGIQLRYQGHSREGWPYHEEAARELAAAGLPRLAAMNEACMGRLQCDLGDEALARLHNERAFAACEAAGDHWLAGLALANLAQLEQELQAFDRARDLLERALSRLRAVGEMHYEAIYASVSGDLFFESGEVEVARRWYAQGARFLGGFLTHRQTAILHASSAALEAEAGDLVFAESQLAVARAGAARVANPVVRLAIELHGANVAISRSQGASRQGALDAAAAMLADIDDSESERGRLAGSSMDVRFAVRMLRRTVARLGITHTASGLEIGPDARWFAFAEGPRVDLSRRGTLRKILLALAALRTESPDQGITVEALAALGWPGERMLAEAASTRVRVAIATLRKLGLRHALLTRDDGYLLDPGVPFRFA